MRVQDEDCIAHAKHMEDKLPLLQEQLDLLSEKLKHNPEVREAEMMSNKLETMIKLLHEIFNSREEMFRGIVFVQRACLVSALAKMLNDAFHPLHSFGVVAGTAFQTECDRNNQLDRFKSGELKVLVATPTLEEGVDVPECGFIIRFTPIETTKSHIQGSGRARHPDSVVYYFENDPVLEQESAAAMNSTAKDRSLSLSTLELDNAAISTTDSASACHPYPLPSLGSVSVNGGEGLVDVFNCKRIFIRYCSKCLIKPFDPKQYLYFYINEPGESTVLARIRYPTPEGWRVMTRDDILFYWKSETNMEDVFAPAEGEKGKSASYKEEMCFVYVIVVHLRKMGWLDKHNHPVEAMILDTRSNCPFDEEHSRSSEIAINDRVIQSAQHCLKFPHRMDVIE